MKYYITGDCHGKFDKINHFCRHHKTTKDDVLVILGDAGINFYLSEKDRKNKEFLQELPITLFLVHGNHEERPYLIDGYITKEWNGGTVYYEEEFSNILFAKDGEIYDLDGKKAMVIGGAYSVDKQYRLLHGYGWFESEQPSPEIKEYVEKQLEENGWKVDYVFSHTCPLDYEPVDLFLDFIDQNTVDKSTEEWLNMMAKKLSYDIWYFGHFHENRDYADAIMLYEEIRELGSRSFVQKVGRPKYSRGDSVVFYFDNGQEKFERVGRIEIVDAYGTFGQADEVSYDIKDLEERMLYKHIPESEVCGFLELEQ